MLFPHLAGVVVERVDRRGDTVEFVARVRAASAVCPGCGTVSARVHGRYRRRLVDAAVAGASVVISLVVRRFRCEQPACAAVTFAEQVAGLTSPHARYTPLAARMVTAIGLAAAGRAGARLAAQLGITAGRDTLLRRVRAVPDPPPATVTVLGVDDFALRRGHVYGTVLLDMHTRRPVDVLPGRDAAPLAEWLRAHPGIRVICRDRAGAYAEGARQGAPQAVQVADRWHLWHNLGQAVEATVAAHHACVRASRTSPPPPTDTPETADTAPTADTDRTVETATAQHAADHTVDDAVPTAPDGELDVCGRQRRLVARTRARHAAVHDLLAAGRSLTAISHELELDHSTVRRFARAATVAELLVKATNRTSVLDRFADHLTTRSAAGVTDATALHAELQALGFTGSVQTIRRYLHPLRPAAGHQPSAARPRPAVPKPRRLTGWIMTDPDHLTDTDRTQLTTALASCPELAATARHVREFADLMRTRRGERLPDWMHRVQDDNLPALHSRQHSRRPSA